jgi:hypothetical protein
MEDVLKINIVKTDTVCFISDCNAISGYDYQYHRSKIADLYFDGKLPEKTFYPNWLKINQYPKTVKRLVQGKRINEKYEIKNKELISEKLPEIIQIENKGIYDYDVLETLYEYKYEKAPSYFEDVSVELLIVCEVDNFHEPIRFDYETIIRNGFKDEVYHITNANINHQLFDKMIFPEIVLHNRPCSLSSKQVYDITRQYVKEHIDSSKARITSDYDFCFTVKKIIPLIEPENITYQNIFARTKKERGKIHYTTKSFKEVEIFQMTHDQKNYDGYTAINGITANSEVELKEKLDEWLTSLVTIINKPLELCPHCDGTGYLNKINMIDKNKIISEINKN